jgi:hypothetical protein
LAIQLLLLCWAVERDVVVGWIPSLELVLFFFSIFHTIFDVDIDEPSWAFPLK